MGKGFIVPLLLIVQLFVGNGLWAAPSEAGKPELTLADGLQQKTIYQQMKHYGKMDKLLERRDILKNGMPVADLYIQFGYLYNGDLYYLLRAVGKEKRASVHTLTIDLGEYIQQPETVRYFPSPEGSWTEKRYERRNLPPKSHFVRQDHETRGYFSAAEVYKQGEKVTLIPQPGRSQPPFLAGGKLQVPFHTGAGLITEQWGIVSKKNMVNWEHKVGLEAIYLAEKYKWTMLGMYYPLPPSYTPYYENGYYYNPAQHVGEAFLRKTDGGSFLEDFALASLYNSVEMQNAHGFWWITTQSNWLYKDYGIPSTYYDTRWSTDAALFLLRGYQKYQDSHLLQAAEKYGRFFTGYARKHHFQTDNQGILVHDYWHPLVNQPVHSSLNHHLAEMNFLLELYVVTGKEDYLDVAKRMKQGIKDVAKKFVKPNGDLWYAYMPDGTFGLLDYPLLTLLDLEKAQQMWMQLESVPDPDLQFLIDTKKTFRQKLSEKVR